MAAPTQIIFYNRARLKVLVGMTLEAINDEPATVQLHDERGRYAEGTNFPLPPRGTPYNYCQDVGANEFLASPTCNVKVTVIAVTQVMKA